MSSQNPHKLIYCTLALHKLDENKYKFTRCQKRSLSTALKKIRKENPDAIEMYTNGYVPNGVNVLNVLKERLKEGKVTYKATHNVIKILEEMSEEELIRTVQEILKKDVK